MINKNNNCAQLTSALFETPAIYLGVRVSQHAAVH